MWTGAVSQTVGTMSDSSCCDGDTMDTHTEEHSANLLSDIIEILNMDYAKPTTYKFTRAECPVLQDIDADIANILSYSRDRSVEETVSDLVNLDNRLGLRTTRKELFKESVHMRFGDEETPPKGNTYKLISRRGVLAPKATAGDIVDLFKYVSSLTDIFPVHTLSSICNKEPIPAGERPEATLDVNTLTADTGDQCSKCEDSISLLDDSTASVVVCSVPDGFIDLPKAYEADISLLDDSTDSVVISSVHDAYIHLPKAYEADMTDSYSTSIYIDNLSLAENNEVLITRVRDHDSAILDMSERINDLAELIESLTSRADSQSGAYVTSSPARPLAPPPDHPSLPRRCPVTDETLDDDDLFTSERATTPLTPQSVPSVDSRDASVQPDTPGTVQTDASVSVQTDISNVAVELHETITNCSHATNGANDTKTITETIPVPSVPCHNRFSAFGTRDTHRSNSVNGTKSNKSRSKSQVTKAAHKSAIRTLKPKKPKKSKKVTISEENSKTSSDIGGVTDPAKSKKVKKSKAKSKTSSDVTAPKSKKRTGNGEPRKRKLIIIGSSIVRGLGKLTQSDSVDSTCFSYPGCSVEHIQPRVKHMVSNAEDFIVIAGGTNNIPREGTADTILTMGRMLDSMIKSKRPHADIIVPQIPHRYDTKLCDVHNEKIDRINGFLKYKCSKIPKVHYLPMNLTMFDLNSRDKLHLSTNGSQKYADCVVDLMDEIKSNK